MNDWGVESSRSPWVAGGHARLALILVLLLLLQVAGPQRGHTLHCDRAHVVWVALGAPAFGRQSSSGHSGAHSAQRRLPLAWRAWQRIWFELGTDRMDGTLLRWSAPPICAAVVRAGGQGRMLGRQAHQAGGASPLAVALARLGRPWYLQLCASASRGPLVESRCLIERLLWGVAQPAPLLLLFATQLSGCLGVCRCPGERSTNRAPPATCCLH